MAVAHKFAEKARTKDVIISERLSFESLLLSEPVLRGLKNAGFDRPSPIQLKAIPLGRFGLDLIVQAKSGTGKTCVFSVVALESIIAKAPSTQVLVLAPTREIALQIWDVIVTLGSAMPNLKCHTFIGGLPVQEDKKKLQQCHIAIGTPGRIQSLIEQGHLKTQSIRLFILDEADKLLEEGFQPQINWIYSSLPTNKQILALSATYPESMAQHLCVYMRNPTFVRLNITDPTLLGIKQYHIVVPSHPLPNRAFEAKTAAVIKIISSISFSQCLIFSNLQTRAQNLQNELVNQGWPTTCIAGCLDQQTRIKAMNRLKSFECRILVSTDLTSRGIDSSHVNLVINMDVPWTHETYLHRIGRAGRFGSYGAAITIVNNTNELVSLQELEEKITSKILPMPDPIPRDLANRQLEVKLDDVVSTEKLISYPNPILPLKKDAPSDRKELQHEGNGVNGVSSSGDVDMNETDSELEDESNSSTSEQISSKTEHTSSTTEQNSSTTDSSMTEHNSSTVQQNCSIPEQGLGTEIEPDSSPVQNCDCDGLLVQNSVVNVFDKNNSVEVSAQPFSAEGARTDQSCIQVNSAENVSDNNEQSLVVLDTDTAQDALSVKSDVLPVDINKDSDDCVTGENVMINRDDRSPEGSEVDKSCSLDEKKVVVPETECLKAPESDLKTCDSRTVLELTGATGINRELGGKVSEIHGAESSTKTDKVNKKSGLSGVASMWSSMLLSKQVDNVELPGSKQKRKKQHSKSREPVEDRKEKLPSFESELALYMAERSKMSQAASITDNDDSGMPQDAQKVAERPKTRAIRRLANSDKNVTFCLQQSREDFGPETDCKAAVETVQGTCEEHHTAEVQGVSPKPVISSESHQSSNKAVDTEDSVSSINGHGDGAVWLNTLSISATIPPKLSLALHNTNRYKANGISLTYQSALKDYLASCSEKTDEPVLTAHEIAEQTFEASPTLEESQLKDMTMFMRQMGASFATKMSSLGAETKGVETEHDVKSVAGKHKKSGDVKSSQKKRPYRPMAVCGPATACLFEEKNTPQEEGSVPVDCSVTVHKPSTECAGGSSEIIHNGADQRNLTKGKKENALESKQQAELMWKDTDLSDRIAKAKTQLSLLAGKPQVQSPIPKHKSAVNKKLQESSEDYSVDSSSDSSTSVGNKENSFVGKGVANTSMCFENQYAVHSSARCHGQNWDHRSRSGAYDRKQEESVREKLQGSSQYETSQKLRQRKHKKHDAQYYNVHPPVIPAMFESSADVQNRYFDPYRTFDTARQSWLGSAPSHVPSASDWNYYRQYYKYFPRTMQSQHCSQTRHDTRMGHPGYNHSVGHHQAQPSYQQHFYNTWQNYYQWYQNQRQQSNRARVGPSSVPGRSSRSLIQFHAASAECMQTYIREMAKFYSRVCRHDR